MKMVLACPGGLDTSLLLCSIEEKYNAEMSAFCADIGQEERLDDLDMRARNTGALEIYINELQAESRHRLRLTDDLSGPIMLGAKIAWR